MKKILFLCLTALPLSAFSADGMPQDLKRFLTGLTAAERDNLGEMVANEMRQKNKDNLYSDSGLRFIDVRYRSSDDTFVMMAAESPDQDSVADSMQSMVEQEFARMMLRYRNAGFDDDRPLRLRIPHYHRQREKIQAGADWRERLPISRLAANESATRYTDLCKRPPIKPQAV